MDAEEDRSDLIYHESQTAALCGVREPSTVGIAPEPLLCSLPGIGIAVVAGPCREHPAASAALQVSAVPPSASACRCRHTVWTLPCSEVEMAQIAHELDAAEHELMASAGLDNPDFLQ